MLVKKAMLRYVWDARAVLCEVRLVGAWIKRREMVYGKRRIRSEKLKEDELGCR